MANIKLHANNRDTRGPGKVFRNLVKGLAECHHVVNDENTPYDYEGFLQMSSEIYSCPPTSLLGPNLVVKPGDLNTRFLFEDPNRHFVVPCQWVKDFYQSFDFVQSKLHVWSVGIDVEEWKDVQGGYKEFDCFLYIKNRSANDRRLAQKILDRFNLKYTVIEYGYYQEQELKDACEKSRFCVMLANTESQGIALMQILSSNIPCYVFNTTMWKSECGQYQCAATSAPYFNEQCGELTPIVDLEHFERFLINVGNQRYNPRSYIVSNHRLSQSAKKYVELLELAKST